MFTPVSYTLATEEAERIGVDHVARSSVVGTTLTSAGVHCVGPFGYTPTIPSLSSLQLPNS